MCSEMYKWVNLNVILNVLAINVPSIYQALVSLTHLPFKKVNNSDDITTVYAYWIVIGLVLAYV